MSAIHAKVHKTQLMGWVALIPRKDGTVKTVPCGSWQKCQYFADWYMKTRENRRG